MDGSARSCIPAPLPRGTAHHKVRVEHPSTQPAETDSVPSSPWRVQHTGGQRRAEGSGQRPMVPRDAVSTIPVPTTRGACMNPRIPDGVSNTRGQHGRGQRGAASCRLPGERG